MKELSIFIDESGDFDEYNYHSPWYIVTMVFHEQDALIQEPMEYLERRKIFNKMVTFMRQSGVKYKSFYIEKKHIEDIVEATGKLSKSETVGVQTDIGDLDDIYNPNPSHRSCRRYY